MADNKPSQAVPVQVTENKPERTEQNTNVPVPVGPNGVQFDSLEGIWRFSQYVARSGWAPKGTERPEQILVAITMGLEVGLKPLQAIQSIAVINGRPSIWGDAMKGLIESSGECLEFAEFNEGKFPDDDYMAICEIHRRGKSRVIRQEFSIADAKRAGLWGKSGPWTQYPKRMLQLRARGFAARDAFPDILRGIYTREEAEDFGAIDITATPIPESKPTTLDEVADRQEQKKAKQTRQKATESKMDAVESTSEPQTDSDRGEVAPLTPETPTESNSASEAPFEPDVTNSPQSEEDKAAEWKETLIKEIRDLAKKSREVQKIIQDAMRVMSAGTRTKLAEFNIQELEAINQTAQEAL